MSWDILGLGCVAVDDLLYLDGFPTPDTKMRVRRRERQGGGLTANALVAASRLGASCAFAGVLGHDPASQFVLDNLQREGIDTSCVVFQECARPIHSTILVDERHHTRTILFDLTGATGASVDRPAEEVIRSTRVLFVDHYGIEGMIRAAKIARAAGIAVVGDLERNEWPGFDELMALVDHLIVSHEFALKLAGVRDPAALVQALWRKDRQAVVVTCGAQGAWYRGVAGEIRHQPAFAVEVVDTTGCGDVFHGAYAASLAVGLPLEQRIARATAAAALKARHPGAQAGCPRLADVLALTL